MTAGPKSRLSNAQRETLRPLRFKLRRDHPRRIASIGIMRVAQSAG